MYTFNLDILKECNLDKQNKTLNCRQSPIYPNNNIQIDNLNMTLIENKKLLDQISEHIKDIINPKMIVKASSVSKKIKKGKSITDDNDEEIVNMNDLGIYLTESKAKILRQNLNRININLCGSIKLQNKNKKYLVSSDIIDQICDNILDYMNKIADPLYTIYINFINKLSTYDLMEIITFIIEIDIAICNAKNAKNFKYYKPNVVEGNSFIDAKDIRHPLVEKIINSEYITNNINLGKEKYGMLLYGCNSTGKSVLTKSIGLNIIMAQAGMYVPSILTFGIYNKIITRLTGEDDILAGKSSFVVEMQELRNILRNMDSSTLVLGDELCRGTESDSGTSISIQSILELLDHKSTFIFSTHIHNISTHELIVNRKDLYIGHLTVHYDDSLEMLIYDRKLKEGSGNSTYGLEVAKSLDIDSEFIRKANVIRKKLIEGTSDLLSKKKSKYNNDIYVDTCNICKTRLNLESHHIKEQSNADIDGFIDNMPKNASYNILVLCKKCHQKIHQDNIKLNILEGLNTKVIK